MGLCASQQIAGNGLVFYQNLWYYVYVRVFKNTWFARFADREGITDGELREMVNQLEAGKADANLGG